MLQTHGTFFQRGTRSLSLSGSLNCQNSCSKMKKRELPLKRREKDRIWRGTACSMAVWIDNEPACNVLKAFVPYRRENSSEMTSTHILAVLIYQARLWCWPSAASLGSHCCNKPQQRAILLHTHQQEVPSACTHGSLGAIWGQETTETGSRTQRPPVSYSVLWMRS